MKKYIVPIIKTIAMDANAQFLLVTSGGGNNVDNPSMGWGDDAPLLRRDFDFDEDE